MVEEQKTQSLSALDAIAKALLQAANQQLVPSVEKADTQEPPVRKTRNTTKR